MFMNIFIIVGYFFIMYIMFLLFNWIVGGFFGFVLLVKKLVVIFGSYKVLLFVFKVFRFLLINVGLRRLMLIVCIILYLMFFVFDLIIVCKWVIIMEDEKDKDKFVVSVKYGMLL